MSKSTVKNYSDEMVATIIAEYVANPTMETVNALATSTGKTTRSLIAKLSREGVYKKKVATTKSGGKIQSKADIVKLISERTNVSSDSIATLVKATKHDLQSLLEAL